MKAKETKTDYEAIRKLAGTLKGNKEEWEKIKKEIYEQRKKTRVRTWSW